MSSQLPHGFSRSGRFDKVAVRLVNGTEDLATLRRVASIHCQEVPEGFLSTLGEIFLTALYRYLSRTPACFLIVAEREREVMGFICCSTDTSGLYGRFLRSEPFAVGVALVPRLWRLRVLKRLWEVLTYPKHPSLAALPGAEILNFCVSGDSKGRGIGDKLFGAAMAEFASRNTPCIRIVTGANQVAAQKLYEARGARRICELEVHRGIRSIAYSYDIPPLDSVVRRPPDSV